MILLRFVSNQVTYRRLGAEPGGGVLAKRLERLLGLHVADFLECGITRVGTCGHSNELRGAERGSRG